MDSDEASPMYFVPEWLGNNLRPDGAKNAALLRAEAERLGLPPCKLADSWR